MSAYRIRYAAAVLAAVAVVAGPVVAASSLPGGANSLRETYDQWVLNCGLAAGEAADAGPTVTCSMTQQLVEQSTRRRAVAIGLTAAENGGVNGTLVMPFGLALADGVALQIDDGPQTKPASFRTCTPQGCLIPIEWSERTVSGLRTGSALKLSAKGDNGRPVDFSLSLAGFATALDRARELQQ